MITSNEIFDMSEKHGVRKIYKEIIRSLVHDGYINNNDDPTILQLPNNLPHSPPRLLLRPSTGTDHLPSTENQSGGLRPLQTEDQAGKLLRAILNSGAPLHNSIQINPLIQSPRCNNILNLDGSLTPRQLNTPYKTFSIIGICVHIKISSPEL